MTDTATSTFSESTLAREHVEHPNVTKVIADYLDTVRYHLHHFGTLTIFDESINGMQSREICFEANGVTYNAWLLWVVSYGNCVMFGGSVEYAIDERTGEEDGSLKSFAVAIIGNQGGHLLTSAKLDPGTPDAPNMTPFVARLTTLMTAAC